MVNDPEHKGRSEDGSQEFTFRRRLFSLPSLIAYFVAAGAVALLIITVFDIDWGQTWAQVRSTDIRLYILAIGAYYLSFLFRGGRWILIARSARLHEDPDVRLPSLVSSAAIILMGWFANAVAFMRLGDAYRGWAFAREARTTFSASMGTILGERVQDMAAVLILLLVAAAGIGVNASLEVPGPVIVAAVSLVGFLAALLLAMRFLGFRVANRLPARFQSFYARFHGGALGSFKPRELPPQLLLGIVGWMLEALRLYFVSEGLGLELNLWVPMFAALAGAMLSTIPTPGGFGFVEGGLTGVLILLGLGSHDAFVLTLVDRSISWISIIIIGGAVFFAWQALKIRNGNDPRAAPIAGASEDTR